MLRVARRFWSGVPPILRVSIVIECVYAVVLLIWEWADEYAWCAQICEDKDMTIWDVARENLSFYCLDTGFVVLAIGAALLARRVPVVSTIMASLPILGSGTMLTLFLAVVVTTPNAFESLAVNVGGVSPLLALLFVSTAVCAIVIVDSGRNRALVTRRHIPNEATT